MIKEIEKNNRQNIGIYLNYQKSTRVLKKLNNPELGTGWHRKKRVKITTTYNQNTNKSQASRDPPQTPKQTNKQTNKQTLLRA